MVATIVFRIESLFGNRGQRLIISVNQRVDRSSTDIFHDAELCGLPQLLLSYVGLVHSSCQTVKYSSSYRLILVVPDWSCVCSRCSYWYTNKINRKWFGRGDDAHGPSTCRFHFFRRVVLRSSIRTRRSAFTVLLNWKKWSAQSCCLLGHHQSSDSHYWSWLHTNHKLLPRYSESRVHHNITYNSIPLRKWEYECQLTFLEARSFSTRNWFDSKAQRTQSSNIIWGV